MVDEGSESSVKTISSCVFNYGVGGIAPDPIRTTPVAERYRYNNDALAHFGVTMQDSIHKQWEEDWDPTHPDKCLIIYTPYVIINLGQKADGQSVIVASALFTIRATLHFSFSPYLTLLLIDEFKHTISTLHTMLVRDGCPREEKFECQYLDDGPNSTGKFARIKRGTARLEFDHRFKYRFC